MTERTPQEILESDLEEIFTVEQAAKNFIEADTKFLGLGNGAEGTAIFYGSVTAFITGVLSTIYGLRQLGVKHNPNESREEAERTMDGVVADLAERLDEGSQRLVICTNVSVGGDACTEEQVFELKTPNDVLVMAKGTLERHDYADTHQTAELEPDEAQAFQIALDGIEAPSERTNAFDAEVVSRMDQAIEAYVAQVPKDKIEPLTTTEWAIGPGGFVLSSLLIAAGVASRRVRMRNLRHATQAATKLRYTFADDGIAKHVMGAALNTGAHNIHHVIAERASDHHTAYHHSGILRGNKVRRLAQVQEQFEIAKNDAYHKYDEKRALTAGE